MCAYPKELEEVAAHHTGPRPPASWEHNNRRHLIRLVPPIPGLWTCFVHAPCVCNEIVSATNRVLGVVPLPTAEGIRMMQSEARKLAWKCGTCQPLTLEQTVETFRGTRRKRYQEAYESLVQMPLA